MNSKWKVIVSSACLIVGSAFASAQQASEHEGHHPEGTESQKPAPQASGDKGMMAGCAMMQQHMDTMRAAQDEEQVKLDGLVKAMNDATGPAKADAIAAVVTEMVDSAKKIRAAHEDAMHQMMHHMSEHMMKDTDPAKKAEMMKCPMMSGHASGGDGHEGHGAGGDGAEQAPKTPSSDEHAGHHQN